MYKGATKQATFSSLGQGYGTQNKKSSDRHNNYRQSKSDFWQKWHDYYKSSQLKLDYDNFQVYFLMTFLLKLQQFVNFLKKNHRKEIGLANWVKKYFQMLGSFSKSLCLQIF